MYLAMVLMLQVYSDQELMGLQNKSNSFPFMMNSHDGGYNSDIINGIEYAVIQHKKNIQSKKKGFRGR